MNKMTCLFGSAAAAVSILSLATPADAYGIAGFSGKPFTNSQASCFTQSNSSVYNNSTCSPELSPQWDVYFPVNAGTYTPSVSVFFLTAGYGMSCAPYSWNPATRTVTTPGWVSLEYEGTYTLGSVSVPTDGFMFVACNMGLGSYLDAVNY
jgi:hypothetical protein